MRLYRVAFEESSLAQDFTSLLLSSVRPAAGGASMSPALKAAVPLGALGGARILPQGSQKADLAVSIGWKKSALEAASQTLIAAADRIARGSGETGRFVTGVLKIRAAGWGIVQMPSGGGEAQQGVLKVFYGFQKGIFLHWLIVAGSDYHDPGVGFLKESRFGELVFSKDAKFADKKDRTLRVRVESKDGLETSFAGPTDFTGKELSEVEIELIKARNSLFDEELYHEVVCLRSLLTEAYQRSENHVKFWCSDHRERDHSTPSS
jgi:mediator of RNA polymerase II transcription subunit 17